MYYFHSRKELIDAFNEDPRHKDVEVEVAQLYFKEGFEKYSRDILLIYGPYGSAEASPLESYFDNPQVCVSGAITSVLSSRPDVVRKKIELNNVVVHDADIDLLDNPNAVKIKTSSFDSLDLVKKTRDVVGSSVPIRIDCNGSFDIDEAEKVLIELKEIDLEYVEQPCRTNEENAALRKKVDVPIAIDETACTHQDIDEIKRLGAGDIVILKVQPSGGIQNAYDIAEHWGSDVVVSSMMESSVGITLGIELAKAVPILSYSCGLKELHVDHIVSEPFNVPG